MRFSWLRLLSVFLLCCGLRVVSAQAISERSDDVSIRLKGEPTVYIQKSKVEVVELRGDRKDPNFVERSWASAQVRDRSGRDRQGPEKIQLTPVPVVAEKKQVNGKPSSKSKKEVDTKRPMKRNKASVIAAKPPANRTSVAVGPIVTVSKSSEVKDSRVED